MAYEYDDAPRDGRILWGRIAVYGVAFLLVFLVGSWIGGRGEDISQADYDALTQQVQELRSENAQLERQLAAAAAGQEGVEGEADAEPGGADGDADGEGGQADADADGGDGDGDGDGDDAADGAEAESSSDTAGEGDGDLQVYVVEEGDNLYGIATEVYGDGDQWRRIAEENGLDSSNPLTVGQELRIPPAQ